MADVVSIGTAGREAPASAEPIEIPDFQIVPRKGLIGAAWQLAMSLGTVMSEYPLHDWIVASYIVVGVMAIIALGLLEPANVAVLVELKKERPNPAVIQRPM